MGRRMFSGGEGPWADDPNATGWWGDDPPFHVPVFVLTHGARAPWVAGHAPAVRRDEEAMTRPGGGSLEWPEPGF